MMHFAKVCSQTQCITTQVNLVSLRAPEGLYYSKLHTEWCLNVYR